MEIERRKKKVLKKGKTLSSLLLLLFSCHSGLSLSLSLEAENLFFCSVNAARLERYLEKENSLFFLRI